MSGMNMAGTAGAGMGGFFMGMLVGVAVGGLVTLFLTPQTGTETREMVRERLGQFRDVFRASKEDVTKTAEKAAEQMRQSASEMRQGI